MSIEEVQYLETEGYKLENHDLKVIVLPNEGSNIIAIYDKENELDILRVPQTLDEFRNRRMLYGTPVLFPPNRIEDATFQFNNQTYTLEMNRAKENVHIHGWVHDKKWQVVDVNSGENSMTTRFHSSDHPEILRQFPHPFVIEMTIRLSGKCVEQTTRVINEGSELMPVGFGYHTTFNFPTDQSNLTLNVDSYWELNDRHLPTGQLIDVPFKQDLEEGMNLFGYKLDDVYPMKDNKKAIIEHPNYGVRVIYEAKEGFKHWVLFTADGKQDLLAIEPYSWVTNAPNLSLPKEITGLEGINPNEEKIFQTTIDIESL